MIVIVWTSVCETASDNKLPRLERACVVRMDDSLKEIVEIRIDGAGPGVGGIDRILRDWAEVAAAVYGSVDNMRKLIIFFPRAKHKARFLYIKNKCGFSDREASHHATLGAFLGATGEKYSLDEGVPKMIEVIRAQGLESLAAKGHITENSVIRTAREGIFSNDRYMYIGNSVSKRYHLQTCEELAAVRDSNLVGLGKDPETYGWSPCPYCIKEIIEEPKKPEPPPNIKQYRRPAPNATKKMAWERQTEEKASRTGLTKAQIIKQEIVAACEEYGMHAEFAGGTVFVTTIAGEWFFAYNDRPIRLRHKNYSKDTKHLSATMSHYHLQEKRFPSPLHVLRYICEHDLALKRQLMQEVKGEMEEDRYYYNDDEMDIVSRAIIFAANAHKGEAIRRTSLPYILHLAEVAVIAATMTDDLEVIAAAVLHDTLERADVKAADIHIEYGARVCKLVESESENIRADLALMSKGRERKRAAIDYLQSASTQEERIIALSDRLSNIRNQWRGYQKNGEAVWGRPGGSAKPEQKWYHTAMRDALGRMQDMDAWKEYNALVDRLFGDQ